MSEELTPEEVQGWFNASGLIVPSREIAMELAQEVMKIRLYGEIKQFSLKIRKTDKLGRCSVRIASALSVLINDLPTWIEDMNQGAELKNLPGINGFDVDYKMSLMSALLDVVYNIVKREGMFRDHRPIKGRPHEQWSELAYVLGTRILAALKASGENRAFGFGKPTSPALAVLTSALEWMGYSDIEPDAIVQAMRRKKGGDKSRDAFRQTASLR